MREVAAQIEGWRRDGKAVALATVVRTWGSAPRGVGAKMAINSSGEMAGSVSGGCVEGAVIERASEVLRSGRPELVHFGVADEMAWDVGLACGGQIDVLIEPVDLPPGDPSGAPGRGPSTASLYGRLRAAVDAEEPIVQARVVRGPDGSMDGTLLVGEGDHVQGGIGLGLDDVVRIDAREVLAGVGSAIRTYASGDDTVDVFLELHAPPPRLVIVGGVHIAVALTTQAKSLGWRVVVVDPRTAFGSAERFGHADALVQEWPDDAMHAIGLTRSTAVAVLTHDPKLDDPALLAALPSPAFYVGALGSPATQARRRGRLLEAGLDESLLTRLQAPIGLSIGADTPGEIALSVLAQIVAVRHGLPAARAGSMPALAAADAR